MKIEVELSGEEIDRIVAISIRNLISGIEEYGGGWDEDKKDLKALRRVFKMFTVPGEEIE